MFLVHQEHNPKMPSRDPPERGLTSVRYAIVLVVSTCAATAGAQNGGTGAAAPSLDSSSGKPAWVSRSWVPLPWVANSTVTNDPPSGRVA